MPANQNTVSAVRAYRLLRVVIHLLYAALVAACIYPFVGPATRGRRLQRWSAGLLQILAVRLCVSGMPPAGGAVLVVGNHVSWLDIFAINAIHPARFVAKAEVRRWPLIGWLCARGGTLFIDRARRHHTRDINAVMAKAMQDGEAFAVFPEGTTTHGDVVLPFHPSLLQPALDGSASCRWEFVQRGRLRGRKVAGAVAGAIGDPAARRSRFAFFIAYRLRWHA